MERAKARPPIDVVGAHLGDDAVRLVRIRSGLGGRATIVGHAAVPLPPGAVAGGLVRAGGELPAAIARVIARLADPVPVRVALTTPDCAATPYGARNGDPLTRLCARAVGQGPAGDAVVADAVSLDGRPSALVGARRSSVHRTVGALVRSGLRVAAIDGGPVCLVAATVELTELPHATWTAELQHGPLLVRATVSRAGRLEGAVAGRASPGPTRALVSAAGAAAPPVDLLAALRRRLGRGLRTLTDGDAVGMAMAFGAALGGLDGRVTSPDLGRAVVVRPMVPDPADLPRWAVEPLPPSCADAQEPRLRRGARRMVRTRS